MALEDHLGPGLPLEILSAIGYVTTYWAQLEDHAGSATAFLLGTDVYDFRSVASNMMASSKFDALCAAAELKLPKHEFKKIKAIADRAAALTAERNRIIHGSWYPTENPNVATRYSYRAYGSLKQKRESVSAARLRSYGDEVMEVVHQLIAWLDHAGFYESYEAPPIPDASTPSPSKRPKPSRESPAVPGLRNGRPKKDGASRMRRRRHQPSRT
jgi:hypothetical protein